ncbi:hypothetical protein CAPTEDRAFT_89266, partial [Capitella teleta]
SVDQDLLHIPFINSSLIYERAFSVADPRMWNSLQLNLRAIDNAIVFKRHLKTLLFTECYQDFL